MLTKKVKSLKLRYTPDFLAEADKRRDKLAYQSISVGKKNHDGIDRILRLLYQAHQNYYFGFFEASIVLSGILLEQATIILLEEEIAKRGKISCKLGQEIKEISDPEELPNLNLLVLINCASYLGMFPQDAYQTVNTLRHMRNYMIHKELPKFMDKGSYYMATIDHKDKKTGAKVPINVSLAATEVKKYCLKTDPLEIWAYFALTRTREVLSEMFKDRVRRLPPEEP